MASINRYYVLNLLFGLCSGFYYTLTIWVGKKLGGNPAKIPLLFAAFIAMLFGEMLAAYLSDRRGRTIPIRLASGIVIIWAFCGFVAVWLNSLLVLLLGSLAFGVCFGVWHSSLDAWAADVLEAEKKTEQQSIILCRGQLLMNIGYLISATTAFPFVLNFHNIENLATVGSQSLSTLPYVAAALVGMVLIFCSPRDFSSREVRLQPYLSPLKGLAESYSKVWSAGGFKIFAAILAAGGISLLIQYIDHLAPLELGNSVSKKVLSLAALNAVICGIGGIIIWILPTLREQIGGSMRFVIVLGVLLIIIAGLGGIIQNHDQLSPIERALAIGFAESLLLVLPPLMKDWSLDHAVESLKATAISSLGLSKRIILIFATAILWITNWSDVSVDTTTSAKAIGFYWLLFWIAVGTATCVSLGATVSVLQELSRRDKENVE